MSPWRCIAVLWGLAAVLMTGGWLWQRSYRNAGIVDVLWTFGIGGGALLYAALLDGAPLPRALLGILAGLWSLRLGLHLAARVFSEPEDGRYRQLREHWHGHQGKMFLMFQFQALLIVSFSIPFLAVASNQVVSASWTAAGIAVWAASIAGESVADRQLARFRADPQNRGRTCRAGLWRYSRHPNYFFEWLHWFTYVALAAGSRLFWLSLVGPAIMYVFLRWISGIPFTEAQALRTRGEDYRRYQQSTPMLFPWFPRRTAGGHSSALDASPSSRERDHP
jgi:steroid 5-alpha reductase family enzyme